MRLLSIRGNDIHPAMAKSAYNKRVTTRPEVLPR